MRTEETFSIVAPLFEKLKLLDEALARSREAEEIKANSQK